MNFNPLITFGFILLSLAVLFISYQLFRRAAGSLKLTELNMISFIFYFNLIVQTFIGANIILLADAYFNPVLEGIDLSTKIKAYFWILYTMIAMPFSMVLTNIFIWKKFSARTSFFNYLRKPLTSWISPKDGPLKLILLLISAISVLTLLYIYYNIGFIPIIKSFSVKDEIALLQMRTEISRSFPGNIYIKNIFGLFLIPALTYISLCYYRLTKSKNDLAWFIIMFITAFFMLTYDLSKSPFIVFILGFIFLYIYENGKISILKLAKYGVLFFVLLLTVYAVITKKTDFSYLFSYNSGIVGRLFINQISSFYRHLQIFPEVVDFISFDSLSRILPVEYSDRSARIVLKIVSPEWVKNGYGGVYNTIFIGEAYANFGVFGLIAAPIWVGFLIQNFYMLFLRSPKTPVILGWFIYYSYRSNLTGGFNEYLYNPAIIILIILFVLILLTARTIRNFAKK